LLGSIALIRKNLGIIAFGGGTTASVVDSELDPVTEYENLAENDALTCELWLCELLNKADRVSCCLLSKVELKLKLLSTSDVLVIEIFTVIVEFVNW